MERRPDHGRSKGKEKRIPRPVGDRHPRLRVPRELVPRGPEAPPRPDRRRRRIERSRPLLSRRRQVLHQPGRGQARPPLHADGRRPPRHPGRHRHGRRQRRPAPRRLVRGHHPRDRRRGEAELQDGHHLRGHPQGPRPPASPERGDHPLDLRAASDRGDARRIGQYRRPDGRRAHPEGPGRRLPGRPGRALLRPGRLRRPAHQPRLRSGPGPSHGQDPRVRGHRRDAGLGGRLRLRHPSPRLLCPRVAQPGPPLHQGIDGRPYPLREDRTPTICPAPAASST